MLRRDLHPVFFRETNTFLLDNSTLGHNHQSEL